MSEYTNIRPSKVTVGKVDFLPGDTKTVPAELAKALEAKDSDGKHTHPLRRGVNPILRLGSAPMPPPTVAPALETLASLDGPKALAQVRLCTDVTVLASWYAAESREDIKGAIEARGKELQAPKG